MSIVAIPKLADCPICGSRPRRGRKQGRLTVVCYAGSHRLEAIGGNTSDAGAIWDGIARDWARRNSREGQISTALGVIESIATVQHIANSVDNGLNSHAFQLREAARVLGVAAREVFPQ